MTSDPMFTPAPTGSPPPGPDTPGAAKPGNGLAVAGFIVGLFGFLGSFVPLLNVGGIVLGAIGAVLAGIGLAKARKSGSGKGLALAGIILGGLAIVIAIVINVVFVDSVDSALDDVTGTSVSTPADDAADENDPAEEGPAEEPGDEVGTTRDNPAPLGSELAGQDWTVVINSASVVEQDSLGQVAAEGSVLLQVNLTATYQGDDSQGDSPWVGVDFVTADGNTISSLDGSTLFIAENTFDSLGKVFTGASVTGDQIIEVPADWTGGVLSVTPELFHDSIFVAVQ